MTPQFANRAIALLRHPLTKITVVKVADGHHQFNIEALESLTLQFQNNTTAIANDRLADLERIYKASK